MVKIIMTVMKMHTDTVQYHKQNKNVLDKIMMTGAHLNFCPKSAKHSVWPSDQSHAFITFNVMKTWPWALQFWLSLWCYKYWQNNLCLCMGSPLNQITVQVQWYPQSKHANVAHILQSGQQAFERQCVANTHSRKRSADLVCCLGRNK